MDAAHSFGNGVNGVLPEREEQETREWARRHGFSKRQEDTLIGYVAKNIRERRRRVEETAPEHRIAETRMVGDGRD